MDQRFFLNQVKSIGFASCSEQRDGKPLDGIPRALEFVICIAASEPIERGCSGQ
jgi:hypothetical protein